MKTKYFDDPKLEVIKFDSLDIITTSEFHPNEVIQEVKTGLEDEIVG